MSLKSLILSGAALCFVARAGTAQNSTLVRDTTDASAAALDWFAAHASPIAAIDAAVDGSDLARWDELTRDARIIGLGEQTHGTSEFTRLKTRLLQHGILTQHVTVLGFEDRPAPVAAVNRFLHGESADADSLMRGLSRLWRTEEVKALLLWLRDYNSTQRLHGAPQVDMVGIDVQNSSPARDSAMAESMAGEMAQRPAGERGMIWAHNIHTSYTKDKIGFHLRRLMGAQYVATGTATAGGAYRAHAVSDTSRRLTDGHVLSEAAPGSVEFSLARLSPRIGGVGQLYDIRRIVADARGGWMSTPRNFHHVGTNTDVAGVQLVNMRDMFDIVAFIPRTTSAHSVVGIEL